MLIVDRKQIKLPHQYLKINNISPALHGSLVFLGIAENYQDCLVHISSEGKLIAQLDFIQNMDAFGMLNDRECMVLETRRNNILVWNLETHQKTNIPFQFKAEEVDKSHIHIFPDTNLVCIQENSRYETNFFKLTYYIYPIKPEDKPYHVFESEDVWNFKQNIYKANNHSTICWAQGRQDQGFELRAYDLKVDSDNKIGHYRKYQHHNDVGKNYGIQKCQVSINSIWEMRPDQYMLVCSSNRTEPKNAPINNNFVWDVKEGTMREAKFTFGKYQASLLDYYNFGNTCMFRSFEFQNGQPVESPVYYINNETEEIIAQEKWKCSYLYKYDFPGYDGNLLVQGQYANANVNDLVIECKKILTPKEITIHFLNGIIENPDDDLLYEVIENIDYAA